MTDRDEWLEWRRAGIGASDVAGILGISPWESPYSVWANKVGLVPGKDITEAMELGLAMEGTIARLFHQRTGLYVASEQAMCEHPDKPWARASLDGRVYETPNWERGGELGNLESKTTSDSPAKWEQEIPAYYAAQVQWQMWVTGATHTWVACMHASFGLAFRVYEVERDEADIAFIVPRVEAFWNDHVQAGVPPETDATAATTETLKQLAADPGAVVDLSEHADLFAALHRAKADAKLAGDRVVALENTIKARMGECTEALVNGDRVATWRSYPRTSIDVKALRAEKPDIAAEYESTTESRKFLLSKEK